MRCVVVHSDQYIIQCSKDVYVEADVLPLLCLAGESIADSVYSLEVT